MKSYYVRQEILESNNFILSDENTLNFLKSESTISPKDFEIDSHKKVHHFLTFNVES